MTFDLSQTCILENKRVWVIWALRKKYFTVATETTFLCKVNTYLKLPENKIFLNRWCSCQTVTFDLFQISIFKNKTITAQKMEFSIKDFFSKCDQIQDLVTFTKEILNGKLHFLCSDRKNDTLVSKTMFSWSKKKTLTWNRLTAEYCHPIFTEALIKKMYCGKSCFLRNELLQYHLLVLKAFYLSAGTYLFFTTEWSSKLTEI